MIRRFLTLLFIGFFVFGFVINDAQAKRFGGGRSFGAQRSISQPASNNFANRGAAAPAAGNKWMAPLAGLALGGLLASLFMGNGFGTGILMWLAIAGVVLLVVRLLRSRTQFSQSRDNGIRDATARFMAQNTYSQSAAAPQYPVGFDAEGFLRNAKTQFIRLQAAYDAKNLNDIREFTTPEVFAEISMQLQERGDVDNKTEVVSLNAELIDATDGDTHSRSAMPVNMVSVRFSGLIREEASEPAHFNEVWHFRKDIISSNWIIAGVQQH